MAERWSGTRENISLRKRYKELFLISNFRSVLNVVFFRLGHSSVSKFYVPTFRNTVSSIFVGDVSYIAYEDGTDGLFRNVGTYN